MVREAIEGRRGGGEEGGEGKGGEERGEGWRQARRGKRGMEEGVIKGGEDKDLEGGRGRGEREVRTGTGDGGR